MRIVHACLLLICLTAHAFCADAPISIRLPSKTDLANLSDLVAKATNVSLKYDPQKLRGSVRLNIENELDADALWDVYNQVLISQQYATVVTGNPAVYHVVPFNEAAMLSGMITAEQVARLTFKPSYLVVVHELTHLPPDRAVQAISAVFFGNQAAQVRTLGQDDSRIVLAGVSAMVSQALSLLERLDQEDAAPVLRTYTPQYATTQSLMSTAMAAWSALNRMSPGTYSGEIQASPDQARLLLIASQKHIDTLEKLVTDLDTAEPLETHSYTPRFFTIDDVADLLEQIFAQDSSSRQPKLIRDNLTSALVIRATAGQHQRVRELMQRLDNVPPESQQSMRNFVIKNRNAADLVTVLAGILQQNDSSQTQQQSQQQTNTGNAANNANTNTANAGAGHNGNDNSNDNTTATDNSRNNTGNNSTANTDQQDTTQNNANAESESNLLLAMDNGAPVRLTTDSHTNSIIAVSTPQQLAGIEQLIMQLDQRQPQVQLEIIMVNLSDKETRELGVELAHQFKSGGSTHNLSSLFNLSEDINADPGLVVPPDNFAGFAGTVVNPGNFAAMIRALETVTNSNAIIRSNAVVGNNADSTINAVREEPLTNFNTGDRFATTTFSGTLSAGTEIQITPQISAADYVTLSYEISQSAFLGESTITADGGTVPPPKREDSLNSVATIPDGYVIALGGLTNEKDTESISKVPILGSIPLLGLLFRSKVNTIDRSTFHIFIKATILRHENFETLKYRSKPQKEQAGLADEDWPSLEPRIIR